MKKRSQYQKRLLFIALLMTVCIAFALISSGGLSVTKGRCIKTENDVYMVVDGNSPVQMANSTNHKAPFRKYSTGDEILIVHGPVAETYPAQTAVHWAVKLGGGTVADVPRNIIAQLEDMGWAVVKE